MKGGPRRRLWVGVSALLILTLLCFILFKYHWDILYWLAYGVLPRVPRANPVTEFPSNKIAFVCDRDKYSGICMMKGDGTDLVFLTPEFDWAKSPVWSPDGQHIAFTAKKDSEGLWVMDADGSNKVQLFESDHYIVPYWSPDSQYVLFQTESANAASADLKDIYVIDRQGVSIIKLSGDDCPAYAASAAWSPIGDRVAFVCRQDYVEKLFVVNRNGSELTNLSSYPLQEYQVHFSWSPDGRHIISQVGSDGPPEIFVVSTARLELEKPSTYLVQDQDFAWSPDGEQIAFTFGQDYTTTGIYVMDQDGTNAALVVHGVFEAWSADSNQIFYWAYKSKYDLALCAIGKNGEGQVLLSDDIRSFSWYKWSPDRSHLAYDTQRPFGDIAMGHDLFVIRVDDRQVRRLSNPVKFYEWSSDSRYLVYCESAWTDDEHNYRIMISNADGTQRSRLAFTESPFCDPTWQP